MNRRIRPTKGTGTLTGVGIYESGTTPFIKVCKYKFKRESTTPGAFTEGCPP